MKKIDNLKSAFLALTLTLCCFVSTTAQDECSTAVTLEHTTNCQSVAATVADATDSGLAAEECGIFTGTANDDIWFSFVASGTEATILVDADFDAVIQFYEGTCGSLTNIGCADGGNPESIEATGLTDGATYLFRVYSYTSTSFPDMTACVFGAPAACAAPTVTFETSCVDEENFQVDVNISAVGDASSYSISDDQGSAAITGITSADSYSIGPYPNNTDVVVTLNDADDIDCSQFSGTLSTDCTPPPANDDCSGAISLSHNAICIPISSTIVAATDSGVSDDDCLGTANDDVWFSFVANGSTVTIDVEDDFDGVVELFSGACGSLVSQACADFGPTITDEAVVDGDTYYVRVFYYFSGTTSSPDFTICLSGAPINCVAPTVTFDTNCSDEGIFEAVVDLTALGDAASYSITDNQGTAAQTDITAAGTYNFGAYASLTDVIVTLTDDSDINCSQVSESLTLNCSSAPSNDDCSGAIALTLNETCTTSSYSIISATDSGIAHETCDGFTGGTANDDVWFSFVAGGTDAEITLTDPFDGVMQLYSGSCGSLVNIACADDGVEPTVDATGLLNPGDTYYFRVYNYSSTATSTPNFDICVFGQTSPACVNPTVTVEDVCEDGDEDNFYLSVTVDFGSGSAYDIGDDQGSATVAAIGDGNPTQIGPYANGTSVVVTVSDTGDANCTVSADATTGDCTPPPIDPSSDIDDPCACSNANNIDNEPDGFIELFYETVTITSEPGETWMFDLGTTGVLDAGGVDATPTISEGPAGTYTVSFYHEPVIGYTANFSNGIGGSLSEDNSCDANCNLTAADVPTMGQWGLITLALLTLSFLFLTVMSAQVSAPNGRTGTVNLFQWTRLSSYPFDPRLFKHAAIITALLVLAISCSTLSIYGYLALTDVIGTSIAAPIFAYLLHLLAIMNKRNN